MESLSTAASIMGIISISFEYSRIKISYDCLKVKDESFGSMAKLKPTIKRVHDSLSNLTSSMERLCDILQMLKIKPRNAMCPLPVEEELAVGECASDLIKLESLVRRIQQETPDTGNTLRNTWRGYPMVLREEHVEEMLDILETHINALEPLARMPSRKVDGRNGFGKLYTRMGPPTPNSVRLRDDEGRKVLASDEQDGFSSRVKNAMQRLHDEGITFSRLQLYNLLCLLREINGLKEDEEETDIQGETDNQDETDSQDETEYKAFRRQSHICARRLANLAKTKLSRSRPSMEARNIILTLKEFISEVETRSDPQNHNPVSLTGKRKAEAGSGSEIPSHGNDSHNFKRARCMSVRYWWPSMTTRKSTVKIQECGRLAVEDGTNIC